MNIYILILSFIALNFAQSYNFEEHYFTNEATLSGASVVYSPDEEFLFYRGSAFAMAYLTDLNQPGIVTWDSELFSKISPLNQYFILEHERAHHSLGHTYATFMINSEWENPDFDIGEYVKLPNADAYSERELYADCESVYRMKEKFPGLKMKLKDFIALQKELYTTLEFSTKKEARENWQFRLKHAEFSFNCFKGSNQRPRPFSLIKPYTQD